MSRSERRIWHYLSSGPREAVLQRLLEQGFDIASVNVTDPAKWPKVAPTVELARSRQIPVRILRRGDLVAPPAEFANAHCLSVGFGLILPQAFLDRVSVCLNVHGTLLPKYRGARSLNWVIANGERESGVTVHVVDAGIDTGPIVLQRRFPISRFETGPSLARKTLAFEPEVVVDALRLFEQEGLHAASPQPPAPAECFPDRRPEHSEVDPSHSLLDLYDAIRASDPVRYPAYFYVDGEKICIRLWRPDKPQSDMDLV